MLDWGEEGGSGVSCLDLWLVNRVEASGGNEWKVQNGCFEMEAFILIMDVSERQQVSIGEIVVMIDSVTKD